MDWTELAESLVPTIARGDTLTAILRIERELKALPESPFHLVLGIEFSNPPRETAAYFDRFSLTQSERFEVKAIYTETNGFAINPQRWFFDVFGYRSLGELSDPDWLSDWDSDDFPGQTLTGMDELQAVYADLRNHRREHDLASDLCDLLVVAKFQDLIRRSVGFLRNMKCPIIATAHDYDWFAKFEPPANGIR